MISFKKYLKEAIVSNEDLKENIALRNRLTNHYGSLLGNKDHKDSINSYTQESSSYNHHLWQKHKNIPAAIGYSKRIEPGIKKLDSALHSYKSPEDMHVWSSTIHDPRKLKDSNDIVHHPAFLSTTAYYPVALHRDINSKDEMNGDRNHHILKIHVPKESPGAYVDHISKYPGEYEYLLPKGSNLKYHKTETKSEPYHNYLLDKKCKTHTHIHHMELINEKT